MSAFVVCDACRKTLPPEWRVGEPCPFCGDGTDAEPPSGLQLDLLTVVTRLEQVADELLEGSLVASRLVTCDLPRLREHLTPETLEWEESR